MAEARRFASGYLRVPEQQIASESVRGGGLVDRPWLTLLSSPSDPDDAWLKVNCRGHCFYMSASERHSRSSFGLLDAFLESMVGNVPGSQPDMQGGPLEQVETHERH